MSDRSNADWPDSAFVLKVHNLFADLGALGCAASMAGPLLMWAEAAICRGHTQPRTLGCLPEEEMNPVYRVFDTRPAYLI